MISADMSMPPHTHVLMHAAAIISVAALALRDQLKLRAVLLVSIMLNAVYNDLTTPPSYESIFWNIVMFVINLIVLVQIVLDRTHIGMSGEENDLFSAFEILTPGEFRSIVKMARWGTAEGGETMTREGERPPELFYVLTGTATIEKAGRSFDVGPKTFIGEIAFLQGSVASATATLGAGARYVSWPVEDLNKRIEGRQTLKHAVVRLISFDMAMKVARA